MDFIIAYYNDQVIMINTIDSQFVSPEGVRIGMTIKEVLEISNSKLKYFRGYLNYILLKSGWSAGIDVIDADNYVTPDDTTKIDFLFRAGWTLPMK